MHAESKPLPQKTSVPLSLGIFAALVLGATFLGLGAMVFFFNPSTHGFYPTCLFHALTGLNCPSCGGTRALYALLHGNILLALKDNALFLLALIVMAVWSARFVWLKSRSRPAAFNVSPKFLWMSLILAFVFTVVRNLPGFEWLSP